MWQCQAPSDDTPARDFDEATAGRLDATPTLRGISFCQRCHITGPAIHHGQPVEMAAVLGTQSRNEWRLPAWSKTVARVQRGQTGKQGIYYPKLRADPGRFMRLNIAGKVGRPRQEAGIVLPARLDLDRDVRSSAQE